MLNQESYHGKIEDPQQTRSEAGPEGQQEAGAEERWQEEVSVDPRALTLANVLGAKKDAEQTILMVLRRFSETTGLRIVSVDLAKLETLSGEYVTDVQLEVKLPH